MRGHLGEALAAQALKEATGDHVLLVGGGVGGASPLHTLSAHVHSEAFQFSACNICLFVYRLFSR